MSHKSVDIPLMIANQLAVGLQEFFSRYGDTTIVGSIRRKSEFVRDIDLIICPYEREKNMTSAELIKLLPVEDNLFISGGRTMAISVYKYNGYKIPINIWTTSKELEGAAIFSYTGPKNYIIGYNLKAKRIGLKLNRKGLINLKNGELLAGKTEEGIYRALGKEWKDPTLRGK